MRILYHVESLGVGGANQTTLTVASAVSMAGHEVWFASEPGPLLDRLKRSDVHYIAVKAAVRHPALRTAAILSRVVRKNRIELLCPNGFDCTLHAIPAGVINNCPVLPTYGGLFNPPYPHPWLPRVNVFSLELAADLQDRFKWDRRCFRNIVARIDAKQFSPEISGARFRSRLHIDSTEPVVLMVCRQDSTKVKGIEVLLDAAVNLRRRVPDVRVVLVGDGDASEFIASRARQLNTMVSSDFIVMPGSTPDASEAFAAADVVVANGARSALEGMACGKPIVSVGPNGFCGVFSPETIEGFRRYNFDKGRLAGNPLATEGILAVTIERILKNEALRTELSRFSLAYSRKNLLIQSVVEEYLSLYREVIADPWGGRWGRQKVALRYAEALMRFYIHRAWRKLTTPAHLETRTANVLTPPAPGLDPEWRLGI